MISRLPTDTAAPAFTAAQIAVALGVDRKTVRVYLEGIAPVSVQIVVGQETAAWALAQLPEPLRNRLEEKRVKLGCRSIDDLIAMPVKRWEPAIPLDEIDPQEIAKATKLREVFKPWLQGMHRKDMPVAEMKRQGVESYLRIVGQAITTRYWDMLFHRARRRDNGAEDWERLELYLPDKPSAKKSADGVVSEALAEMDEEFARMEGWLDMCDRSGLPDAEKFEAIWNPILDQWAQLVAAGCSEKAAARRCRSWMTCRAKFPAPSRDALLKAFNRRLELRRAADWNPAAIQDQRQHNGPKVDIPEQDILRLRASAAFRNGRRVNAAWRSEYRNLSEATRARYSQSRTAPEKIRELVNREKVEMLAAAHQGGKALRRRVGSISRSWEEISSMHSWVVDDMTSNIEVYIDNADGSQSLFQPQIIAVLDSASRKWVGWSVSNDKGPTAELVCEAVLDGMKREGVPKFLGIENGFVFGKSLDINGKTDELGRRVVPGLARFGCTIHHFGKGNPQAKSELEYSFHQLQCLMEKYPGYGGRLQMVDAPESFKQQQRFINSGKVDAAKHRLRFDHFAVELAKLVAEYNSTVQGGRLKGLSPDEAFRLGLDANEPVTKFTPEIEWILNYAPSTVEVKSGSTTIKHLGGLQVRGPELVKYAGQQLRVLVRRRDTSLVTFMEMDYSNPFTMATCQKVNARESLIYTGCEVSPLKMELQKKNETVREIKREYHQLRDEFGDPREEILNRYRQPETTSSQPQSTGGGPVRRVVADPQLVASVVEMEQQRENIQAGRQQEQTQRRRAQSLVQSTGIILSDRALDNLDAEKASRMKRANQKFAAANSAANLGGNQ